MPVSQRIQPQGSLLDSLHRFVDMACIAASLAIAVRHESAASESILVVGAAAVVLFSIIAEISGTYRSWRGTSAEREVLCAVLTWCYTAPALLVLGFFTQRLSLLSHGSLLTWFLLTAVLIAAVRATIRLAQQALRARGYNTRGFAIVGVNELSFQLARNIEKSPQMGLQLRGFFDDRPSERTPEIPEGLGIRLGSIDELVAQAKAGEVNMIYITFPMRAEDRVKDVLEKLSDTTASVYMVPDFFVFELLHSRWTNIGGLPAVSVFENPFYGVDGLIKRAADLVIASLMLLMLAVPMAIIALLIKVTSPGPVFFRQRRYGLDGREIKVWKFRSMRVCEDGAQVAQATKGDPRITPLGAFLRKSSLDELPQLFNVIEGSMSLVGPRPHANTHNELFRKEIQGYMLRHKVKPGITGLAQVNGWRGETDTLYKMEKRIEFDHQYIREWSPWGDIKILIRTVFTIFSCPNAY